MLSYKYVMLGHLWHKIRNEPACIHKIDKCQPKQKQYIFCGMDICNLTIPPHSPNQVLTQSQSDASLFVFFFCLLESSQVCKILSFVITIIKGSNQHILNNWLTLLQKSTLFCKTFIETSFMRSIYIYSTNSNSGVGGGIWLIQKTGFRHFILTYLIFF